MNIARVLGVLLLAAPVAAVGAPHTVVVRAYQGTRSHVRTEKMEAGAQTNFRGKSGDANTYFGNILLEKGGLFNLVYQLEVSRPDGSTFQVQSMAALRPGDRLTSVDCGSWKVEISLDAKAKSSLPPAWTPEGPNYRLTILAGKRRCRLIQAAGTQSDIQRSRILDSGITNGRGWIFSADTGLASPAGNACKLEYQLENTPLKTQGKEILVLGQKRTAPDGKFEFLLEGPAGAAAPAVAAPGREEGGPIPLLR